MRYLIAFTLILVAALSRVLPHPPNMVPITALALFGGVYLDRKLTFIVPMIAMLISDYFIGFHSSLPWVYASFIATGFIGLWLRNHRGVLPTAGATLAGSVLFYVVTNFGAWLGSPAMYTRDLSGLVNCYVMAIPFFRNTLAGDAIYVAVLFGLYEAARRVIPALQEKPAEAAL